VSPILVRPVREQLEHDRIIRQLQTKYKRKFEVAINPGNAQTAPVGGPLPWFPDLVLQDARGKKVLGVVEVETIESVNHLEAMSEWVAFSRLRVLFHLYVPLSMFDVAKRLCQDMQVAVGEIWTYAPVGDQLRFSLGYRSPHAIEPRMRAPVAAAPRMRPTVPARGVKRPPAPPPRQAATKVAAKVPAKVAVKKAASPARKAVVRPAKSATRKRAVVSRALKRR